MRILFIKYAFKMYQSCHAVKVLANLIYNSCINVDAIVKVFDWIENYSTDVNGKILILPERKKKTINEMQTEERCYIFVKFKCM